MNQIQLDILFTLDYTIHCSGYRVVMPTAIRKVCQLVVEP